MNPVCAKFERRNIPTYPIPDPDRHPMFFEKRVYQGSSGRVYPLPFVSRLSDDKINQPWDIWTLENDWIRIELMPELGGRIWRGLDKTNDYDFFYHQPVVKPALVGLAGPWLSGGVEFNWPQHHRPATYLPTDCHLEEHDDGSRTLWMSDHDPMSHLKGTHGITVYPDSSRIDLKARLYNRTPIRQTFLWWANVAAEVHDRYQSFFPPDVQHVADHAVRAMSGFPIANNHYYGVDYRPGTDLSWYNNIPVPTSYMITKSAYGFFGGYDHNADGGFVHVANRHISPGKKQWTWGNHEFGWAWDRELTDPNAHGDCPPYVELMAGVYTDNQPDFSYLLPYETKTFTQSWWPIRDIGVAHQANRDYAAHLSVDQGTARIGLCASSDRPDTRLRLTAANQVIHDEPASVGPATPHIVDAPVPSGIALHDLHLQVIRGGRVELSYTPPALDPKAPIPPSATEPPQPEKTHSNDELYLIGEHLEQYRHPTRQPEPYWEEALARDPGDQRCNTAMGRRYLLRGLLEDAVKHLQAAVTRSRSRHPNPEDGEPSYLLGLAQKRLGDLDEAYRLFYKSTWNYTWRAPGYYQLATIDSIRGDDERALNHLDEAMQTNAQHSHARNLKSAVLRRLGRHDQADAVVRETLRSDALDHWAGFEAVLIQRAIGDATAADQAQHRWIARTGLRTPTMLDIAFDYTEAGLFEEASALLELIADPPAMIGYTRAWVLDQLGQTDTALEVHTACMGETNPGCFPDRDQEEVVLRAALKRGPADGFAGLALGNLLYDKRRDEEAIEVWESARDAMPSLPGVHRNLGIAYFNARADRNGALNAYAKAFKLAPEDAQILSEYDLLLKTLGTDVSNRLAQLEAHRDLVDQRDDLSIERVTLYNVTGQHEAAAELLAERRFHPWEGGEGKVLAQYSATHLALGRIALEQQSPQTARDHFHQALNPPENLGEARHLLANTADIHYHIALAYRDLGDADMATVHLEKAAANAGDFLEMDVTPYSEKSYAKGMALRELNRRDEAEAVFRGMIEHGRHLCQTPATIDYFATSLPDLLVFNADLKRQRQIEGMVLQGLGHMGMDDPQEADALFRRVLKIDPANPCAREMSPSPTR